MTARKSVVLAVLAAAGAAWWVTAARMAGMDAAPGTSLGTLGWFTGAWTVMMAAMMLPSLAPVATAFATTARRPDIRPGLLFATGYLLVWALAGLLAYALFALGKDVYARQLAWRSGGRWLATGVLGVSALYELSPLKRACLAHCRRAPRSVQISRVERRWVGFAAGLRNGRWCVGASWGLMAALFALGVMNLTWMALIAALVTVEKLSPRPIVATTVTACVLGALAVGLIASPRDVPGLVVPAGHAAMHAMRMG